MRMKLDKIFNLYTIVGLAILLPAIGIVGLTDSNDAASATDQEAIKDVQTVVYKSPNCGCCGAWAKYADRRGMDVEVREVNNLDNIKQEHNVPKDHQSCHTTVVGDYVVEGHIPTGAINELLKEQPDIEGIALAGMPQGSPGMLGPKQGEWTIHSFDENRSTSEFMTV